MRTGHLSTTILVAGILGIALGGCSVSPGESDGTGGTTSTGGGSGGEATGGSGSGGSGSGGTTTSPGTGGTSESGGTTETGGATGDGGAKGTGGRTGPGGRGAGGRTTEGNGGRTATGDGGTTGGQGTGGRTGAGGRGTGGSGPGTGGRTSSGTCTPSKDTGKSASGTGPHKVVIESNSDPGINCGTIYRPADLGGDEKYPIFVWGEGGCSRNGLSNQASMAEIASWGYFVVADGPPGTGGGNCGSIGMSTNVEPMAKPLIDYIDWAIEENDKPCSAYFQSLDPSKIAADGFSCGGLMAMGTASDPRMTAVAQTSSGLTSAVASYYPKVHTPFKILLGGSGDVAYTNGMRDYDEMVKAGISVLLLSKNNAGHGGDLSRGTGDFNTVNLAWLNWQLKGDEGEKGKALLIGSSCKFCNASGWEFKANKLD